MHFGTVKLFSFLLTEYIGSLKVEDDIEAIILHVCFTNKEILFCVDGEIIAQVKQRKERPVSNSTCP